MNLNLILKNYQMFEVSNSKVNEFYAEQLDKGYPVYRVRLVLSTLRTGAGQRTGFYTRLL
jgi:hypothetical protein